MSSLAGVALQIISRVTGSFPNGKRFVPKSLRQAVRLGLHYRELRAFPDRTYLENTIIPLVRDSGFKRVLFIGCRVYTRRYLRPLGQEGAQVWTMDIDPTVERWGQRGRHIIGDASTLDETPACRDFDCIMFSGVLGYGIDSPEAIARTFVGLGRVMRPGSLLVLGWNVGRVDDPRLSNTLTALFDDFLSAHVPPRMTFAQSDHVYDFIVRRAN